MDTQNCSMGVGVGIGVAVMLFVGGVCIFMVLIFRKSVASFLAGDDQGKVQSETLSSNRKATPKATDTEKPQQKGVGHGLPGNYYEELTHNNDGCTATYEPVQVYQNF